MSHPSQRNGREGQPVPISDLIRIPPRTTPDHSDKPCWNLDPYLDSPWTKIWARRPGMVVVAEVKWDRKKREWNLKGRELELCDPIPKDVQRIGCGGWDETGALHSIGIDLDVGHGGKNQYATTEEAIEAAGRVRKLVGGAAEIRLSTSGDTKSMLSR